MAVPGTVLGNLKLKSLIKLSLLPAATVAAFAGGVVAKAYADQPYMHQAIDQLSSARATLAEGADNKVGDRIRAIGLVDRAIAEVHAGIDSAR